MKKNRQIESYLKNEISIEDLILLFDKNNFNKEEIKKDGIVYTPMYISDYIVNILKPQLNETIFEPAVGHGMFIFSLLNYIEKEFKLKGTQLKKYFISNVFFQDLQQQNIEELKMILIAYFKKKEISLNQNEIKNFFIGNTLSNSKTFDIIFGNPPYVNIRVMEDNTVDFLRKNFNSCKKGNIDLYYAFIEYAYLNSNRSSFITPNSWLYNTSSEKLRDLVKTDTKLIIDFKHEKIFKEADTYTSIFLFDKTFKTSNKDIFYSENLKDFKNIDKSNLDNKRWSFYQDNYKLSIDNKNINFHTPIATLRDKIFIDSNLDNSDTIPFYKISKIKSSQEFLNSSKSIIFPYKFDSRTQKYIIRDIKELNPDTINYLDNNKEELNKRDKGKVEKYDSWFAYGRKQGLNTYEENTFLIIIPGMISQAFKFFSIDSNLIKKPFLFSSGFILEIKNKKDTELILKYLNSSKFLTFLKNNGKVWQGKNKESSYFSLSMRQLKNIFSWITKF